MKNIFKYIILAIAAVISVSIYVYFSPYHSCMRSIHNSWNSYDKTMTCAKHKY